VCYQLEANHQTQTTHTGTPLHTLYINRAGTKAACFDYGRKQIEIRDLSSGRVLTRINSPGDCESHAAWSADGRYLSIPSLDNHVYVWNTESRNLQATLESHTDRPMEVAFDDTGSLAASTSWDGILRVWEPLTGRDVFNSVGCSTPVQFSPDGSRLGFVGPQGVQTLELARPVCRRLISPGTCSAAFSCSVHPNGRLAVVTTRDGLRFWDMHTSHQAASLTIPSGVPTAFFTPDGEHMITCGDSGIRDWPLHFMSDPTGSTVVIGPGSPVVSGKGFYYASESPDGDVLAAAYPRGRGAVIIPRNPAAPPIWTSDQQGAEFVSVSPHGKWVATSAVVGGGGVVVREGQTGHVVKRYEAGQASFARFSPDGRWLAVLGQECALYQAGTWEFGPALTGDGSKNVVIVSRRLAFSPDSATIAIVAKDLRIELHDVVTGRLWVTLEPTRSGALSWLEFSPDGTQLLALERGTGEIQIWDLRQIRSELADLYLDWDAPKYPDIKAEEPQPTAPLSIQIPAPEM